MSFKGRENVYICQRCGGHTVTVDVDEGVTPFSIRCRAGNGRCPGLAYSAMYPAGERPAHIPPPSWEWYRPTEKEAREVDARAPGSLDHARNGGLFLRRKGTLTMDGAAPGKECRQSRRRAGREQAKREGGVR